jgi:putative intracellular protease/amidase
MTMKPTVICLLTDGYADWEPALALATLRKCRIEVRTAGFSAAPVRSEAGFRVTPDITLDELSPERVRMLVVPGGDSWPEGKYPADRFASKLQELRRARVPVAAICGATVACARAGLFAEHRHTSNDPEWIGMLAPSYAGAELYMDELSVRDRGLITAPGTAPTEFAREILAELGVMSEERRKIWFHHFKTGRLPPGIDAKTFFRSE